MEILLLCYRGEPLRQFELRGRPLELGRAAGCDIVVHDPGVRDRHFLVQLQHGTVMLHPVGRPPSRNIRSLPIGEELALGKAHSLLRLPAVPTRPQATLRATERLEATPLSLDLALVIGRGNEARRVSLDSESLSIGADSTCDLRLTDRAVSGLHCRIEPSADGLRVRDLGSRNGTSVDGVAVTLARVCVGSTIRVGRTSLRLVPLERDDVLNHGSMIAASQKMRDVLEQVERLARLPWPTLVLGESGSGKEGVARGLHDQGPRRDGPFVAINAGGLAPNLIESELFGHEKGAFTGAGQQRLGVFEQANGGTLFLDEIGELPNELQTRLLRVLESWTVRRVGAERAVPVDVRLVCATHRDLAAAVSAGSFRQDLYYRVAQLVVRVPALRERPADIAPLAAHFLEELVDTIGPRRFAAGAVEQLSAHDWPGNVRELRTAVRRVAVSAGCGSITPEEVCAVLLEMGVTDLLSEDRFRSVLDQQKGNLAAAARVLGIPRTTLRDRLKRSGAPA